MGAERSVKQLHCPRFHAHIILPTIRRCEWTAAWTQYFPFILTEGLKAGKQLNAASQDEIKGIRLPVEQRAEKKVLLAHYCHSSINSQSEYTELFDRYALLV